MRAFRYLLMAAFRQFLRDRTAVFFAFFFPLLFMVVFGFVFSDQDPSFKLGLVNNDSSELGRGIVQAIEAVPVFEVGQGELAGEMERLKKGGSRALVVVPAGIQSSIAAGGVANITVYYDPSQAASSQVILSILQEVVEGANRAVTGAPVVLALDQQSVQSHNLRNIDYLVPGIVAMSVLFLGLFGALPMVEWREKSVLKRLKATPTSRLTLVSSQVVYRLVLSLVQCLIIILVAHLVFDVQIVGSWLALLGLVVFGTLTFVSIGYLAVSRPRTVEGAMPIMQLVQFPMLFLSGIFFPIDVMPDFMRPIVKAVPLTYLGDALRQVMVDAIPLHSLGIDLAVLAVWLVATMALTVKVFRWD